MRLNTSLNDLTVHDLRKLIAKEVEISIQKYMKQLPQDEGQWLSIKRACEKLKISRQTLDNWRKHPKTKDLIDLHSRKINGKVLIDAKGLIKYKADWA